MKEGAIRQNDRPLEMASCSKLAYRKGLVEPGELDHTYNSKSFTGKETSQALTIEPLEVQPKAARERAVAKIKHTTKKKKKNTKGLPPLAVSRAGAENPQLPLDCARPTKKRKRLEAPKSDMELEYLDEAQRQRQNSNNRSRRMVSPQERSNLRKREPNLVINGYYCQYRILDDAARHAHFRVTCDEDDDWDIWWLDGMIQPTFLQRMKLYQRTNHLPQVQVLTRKNYLAVNLKRMQAASPEHFNFFPATFMLPKDLDQFREQFDGKKPKTFIIKPEQQCQGHGIFLTRNADWLVQGENYIAQKYIHQPLLIDELKFDLRIYVLITGICPLRCFIFKGGMARFATEKYRAPSEDNLTNLCMHLTNYAINK